MASTSAGTVLGKVLLVHAEMGNQGYIKRDMTGDLLISGQNFVNSLGIEEEGRIQRNLRLSVCSRKMRTMQRADCQREVFRRSISRFTIHPLTPEFLRPLAVMWR